MANGLMLLQGISILSKYAKGDAEVNMGHLQDSHFGLYIQGNEMADFSAEDIAFMEHLGFTYCPGVDPDDEWSGSYINVFMFWKEWVPEQGPYPTEEGTEYL